MKVGEIARFLDEKAPLSASESYDNVGLLIGDSKVNARGAVISIDLTKEALELAKRRGFKLILNHHPAIFPKGRGPSQILESSLVHRAIREGVSVYASHSNFDRCALDVAEMISQKLKCEPISRLHPKPEESLLKLQVYVPESHLDRVRDAVFGAGAGKIGRYDSCGFSVGGEGTFRGDAGTDPFLGEPGALERVGERLLQTIVPKGLEREVVRAMKKVHPYEEVAYDLFPVMQGPSTLGLVRGLGYGFVGRFEKPIAFADFVSRVKRTFGISQLTVAGESKKRIQIFGFAAGEGTDVIGSAVAQGCDALLIGETSYHHALGGARRGTTIIELGHRESERFFLLTMARWMKSMKVPYVILDRKTQSII